MLSPKDKKKLLVSKYVDRINSAKAMYFVKPIGLSSNQASSIKLSLSDENATFSVVKNSLFIKAMKDANINMNSATDSFSKFEHAVLFANGETTSPAKIIKKFVDTNKGKMEILAGYYEGSFVSADIVKYIADLPDKNTMIAITLGTFNAPVAAFARALKAIAEKQEAMA